MPLPGGFTLSSLAQSLAILSQPALPTPYTGLKRNILPPKEETLTIKPFLFFTMILKGQSVKKLIRNKKRMEEDQPWTER